MRVIDIDKYFSGLMVSNEMKEKVYRTFGVDISEKNINIEWLRKEIYEMLYRREIDSDVVHTFTKLIAKWRYDNEHS